MKKFMILLTLLIALLTIAGCNQAKVEPHIVKTYQGNFLTYHEMSDGTWKTEENSYKYRLEISGRLSNAAKESTFIILSNAEDITFEQAAKASGLSSNSEDYFKPEDAVIVQWQ